MQKLLVVVHIAIICALLGGIFGIGFGVINLNGNTIRNYQSTTCYAINYTQSTYNYCYMSCNTTIPSCTQLITMNTSGLCYNETNNISINLYTNCYSVCDTYIILQITFQYSLTDGQIFLQTISYDCKNNQTCIARLTSSVTCYYESNNPQNIVLPIPINYKWAYISVIVILGLLLIFYVLINLTVFKKYNYFCGYKW